MNYCADNVPIWTPDKKVLIRSRLNIPGLHMLGYSHALVAPIALIPHYHHTMEFVVLLKGRQQYMVSDSVYTLRGGDIFMTFPEEIHSNDQLPQELHEHIWFQLDFSNSENFLGLASPYSDLLYQKLSNYRTRILHTSQKRMNILRQAFQMLCCDDFSNHLLGYSCFLEFVTSTLCAADESVLPGTPRPELTKAADYIHTHLSDNPTIEDIASHCNVSPAKLHTVFREYMGITPHAYIRNVKIDTAKEFLKNPDLSITEIAYRLGYSSSNHFSSAFKKCTGYSPIQYRSRCFH